MFVHAVPLKYKRVKARTFSGAHVFKEDVGPTLVYEYGTTNLIIIICSYMLYLHLIYTHTHQYIHTSIITFPIASLPLLLSEDLNCAAKEAKEQTPSSLVFIQAKALCAS